LIKRLAVRSRYGSRRFLPQLPTNPCDLSRPPLHLAIVTKTPSLVVMFSAVKVFFLVFPLRQLIQLDPPVPFILAPPTFVCFSFFVPCHPSNLFTRFPTSTVPFFSQTLFHQVEFFSAVLTLTRIETIASLFCCLFHAVHKYTSTFPRMHPFSLLGVAFRAFPLVVPSFSPLLVALSLTPFLLFSFFRKTSPYTTIPPSRSYIFKWDL